MTDTAGELGGLVGTEDPGSSVPDNKSTVTFNGGVDNLEQGFGFTPPSVSDIGDTIHLDHDTDSTQDSNEPGIEGVTFSLLDESGTEIPTTMTDIIGKHLFESLDAGTHAVVVTDDADE